MLNSSKTHYPIPCIISTQLSGMQIITSLDHMEKTEAGLIDLCIQEIMYE